LIGALASLSIDLDSLVHYRRIHGLPPAPPPEPDPVYTLAAARFGALCDRLGVRGTIFCIGEELGSPVHSRAMADLAAAGHELANHSFSHDYRLTRAGPAELAAEVDRAAEAIARVAGRRPRGFRAPGYTLSAPLLAALAERGYLYDSSTFPALPYWLGKAGVMALLSLVGRPSRAILDRPRVLLAPRVPYRPRAGEPYARGGPNPADALDLLELPVATGWLGFPIIGTFVATLPTPLVRLLASRASDVRRRPLLNLELHGVDLLDASEVPADLPPRQRDLRVPAARKIARIEAFVRSRDREWVTLEEAAGRWRGVAAE
jgi:hypothetical protein